MNKKFWIIFITCAIVVLGVYFLLHRDRSRQFDGTETVSIKKINNKPQLFRNGQPFYIKGASGVSYLKELSEAGGNTLRVYDTINLSALLDEAGKYDIAVIVDIYLPEYQVNSDYYAKHSNIVDLKKSVKETVNQYKNHPSLLIWNLGNEVNYPLALPNNAFTCTYNELIEIIHNEDPNHPISTSVSGSSRRELLGLLLNAPKLDLIGVNTFGNLPSVQPTMNQLSYITNIKPYYISEWGIHGPWEAPINLWKSIIETNSTEKGRIYHDIYQSYIKNNSECVGDLAFYWGYKHEGTITWFNIFDEEGRKSEAYYDLKSAWTEEPKSRLVPKIDELKLNDTISRNLIVLPNSHLDAELTLREPIDSTLTLHWQLYKEAWGKQEWVEVPNVEMLSQSLNSNTSRKIKLKVPQKEGPYRLFVSVNDDKGNFATINRPFYVLARK